MKPPGRTFGAPEGELREILSTAGVRLRARHFFNDAIKRIASFIRAKLPSGFLEPLGLFLVSLFRFWLLLFCHTAAIR